MGWMTAWFTATGLAGGVVATVAVTLLTSRVLPALPVAVALGLIFYAIGSAFMTPYVGLFDSMRVII
jgi:hypothetical protein